MRGLTASTLIGADADKSIESVTIGIGLGYTRPTLSLSHLGIEDLTDPGADRIFFWDNSATASEWLAVGNSIAITTTTIDTIQDIRTTATPLFNALYLNQLADAGGDVADDGQLWVHDDTPCSLWFTTDAGNDIQLTTGTTVVVTAHTHDGDTLQLDGVNSDGGAFSFTTSGAVTFSQSIETTTINLTTNTALITVDGGVFLANNGTENIFMGEGITNGDEGSYNFFAGYHAGYNNNTVPVTVGIDGTSNVYIGARAGAGEVLLTGTIAVTNGSDAVVGTNTLFDSELVVGDVIRIHETYGAYEVATITDDTHLTFTDYTGGTGSGLYSYRERGDNYGNENIAIGHLALSLNSTGYENTAIGDNALKMNTTGHGNVALGNDALQGSSGTAITGNSNTGIGGDALYVITSGSYNASVGYQNLYTLTTGSYNVAIGYQSSYKQTTSDNDVCVGYQAGYNDNGDTTLGDNVFIGYQAFYNNNGQYNIGVGSGAGRNNSHTTAEEGYYNIYIGWRAGYGETGGTDNTGYHNVAIGKAALRYNTAGFQNVAIGSDALRKNTGGDYNMALGRSALYENTTGIFNIGIGFEAGYSCSVGQLNTAIGVAALRQNTGSYNTGIGKGTLRYNTTGAYNVAISFEALKYTKTGNYNIGIGHQAGYGVENNSFSNNTYIGSFAGFSTTTGGSNVFIGYKAGYRQVALSNLLIIDNQERADVATELTNAILYGVMAATPAAQSLRINAEILGSDGAKIGDGGSTNYTEIETDGTLEFHGAATVWEDLQFTISDAKVPASNFPTWETFTTNTKEYSFAVDDYIDTKANETSHAWKLGTSGHVHLHVTTKAANSTGSNRYAKFTVYLGYCDTNETWQETSFTAELTIPHGTSALQMFYLDMGNLTFTNYVLESEIKMRVSRIAATGGTEYAGNIFLTQAGIHFEHDTIGSRAETTK